MKKFVNDPQQFVPEMLKGIELANPGSCATARVQLIMRTMFRVTTRCQSSGLGPGTARSRDGGRPRDARRACPGDVFSAPPSDYVTRQASF
jgi:dihydroxyacetone kinase-like protein